MCFSIQRFLQNKVNQEAILETGLCNIFHDFHCTSACAFLMPPINQKNSYSSWQPVAYVWAVGRESNDAKSGLSIIFPRTERGKWLSKLFLVLCTIAQYLLTLIYHKFLFTNKGSRQLTHSLFWVSSGQYLPIRVNSHVTQKHKGKRNYETITTSVIAPCSSEEGQARRTQGRI